MKKRVLLAEDDPDTRFLLSLILAEQGYDVAAAGDGVEALVMHRTACDQISSPGNTATGVECAVLYAGAAMPTGPKKVRCPYCRSERLRAEPVSRSGFAWHHCIPCGERFSARVADPPRQPMKAGLRPPPAKRKQS